MKNSVSVLVLGAFGLILGCEKAAPTPPQKVTVGYLPIVAHLPAAVAREQGKFSSLNVEFRVFGNSDDLLSAVAMGDVDVATTVALAPVARFVTQPKFKGAAPPVLVYSYSRTTSTQPFDAVFVKQESAIRSLRDVAGKRIGVFPGTTAKGIMGYLLKRDYDIDPSGIEWVFLPPPVQIARVEDGAVDVLYTYETNRTMADLRGLRAIHQSVVASVLDGAPYGCSVVKASFADEHADAARAVIEAFDVGIRETASNEANARRILQARLGVPSDVAQRCNLEERVQSNEIGDTANLKRVIQFLDVLKEIAELDPDVNTTELANSLMWKP